MTDEVLFGLVGWVLAIYSFGFLGGAVYTYRRVGHRLRLANTIIDDAEKKAAAEAKMKLEPARWSQMDTTPTGSKVKP